jgi:carbon starvation protein CstA
MKDYCWTTLIWVLIIFTYYVLATILPIDKIIGKIYPVFAFALLFMAVALLVVLFIKMPDIPELWSDLKVANHNTPASLLGTDTFFTKSPLFPCLFITIACGAISGFHGTQSPLMARCIGSEKMGRPIFYGAMITEGVVALIWATVSAYFFYYGGWREVVDANAVNAFLAQVNTDGGKSLIQYFSAPNVVENVCNGWLGLFGGILAVFGVVAAPITSGDTAFRSARLIIAEALHLDQKPIRKRFYIAFPMFAVAIALLIWQMENPDGFNTIWQWFGWSNQTLAVFTLWTITVYLVQQKKNFWVTLIPSLFMTCVVSTYLFIGKEAFGLDHTLSYILGVICLLVSCVWFFMWYRKTMK